MSFVSTSGTVEYDVFVLAGQSNMDGRGAIKDLTGDLVSYAQPRNDLLIAYSNAGTRSKRILTDIVSLAPGFSSPPIDYWRAAGVEPFVLPAPTFGPELSFGPAFAKDLPGRRIVLLKFSEGGTSLYQDWNPQEPKSLYHAMLEFVRTRLLMLSERGHRAHLRGFLWHQGESDEARPAGEYAVNLASFVQQLRHDLTAPALPVVIAEVCENGVRQQVRAGLRQVAASVPCVGFVPSDGLMTFDNGTHLDAQSQILLGERFAEQMIRLVVTLRT